MKEFEKWIQKAENDLISISNNLQSAIVSADVCCFHAQQAAEKYLKAYLISKSIIFPKTHDLELLIHLCEQNNKAFVSILSIARRLISYSVFSRYPDLNDDLTESDVRIAYDDAVAIKDFVLKIFFD